MSDMTYVGMMNRIKPDAKLILTTKEKMRRVHIFTLKTNGRRQSFVWVCIPVVCVLLLLISAFNVSPTLSYAVQDIPVLKTIVNVITFHQYEKREQDFDIRVNVPEIRGLLDPVMQKRVNADFRDRADSVIKAFEEDIARHNSKPGKKALNKSLISDYTIKTNNDRVLALNVYFYTASASSATSNHFLTIDKQSGKLIVFGELFYKGADYITPISSYIRTEMRRINTEDGGSFMIGSEEDAFVSIGTNPSFYIDNYGRIVICFDKYQVAAGVQGSPEFIIPKDVIRSLSSSDLIAK